MEHVENKKMLFFCFAMFGIMCFERDGDVDGVCFYGIEFIMDSFYI